MIIRSYRDKHTRITLIRCDLCGDQLPQTEGVNLESRMKIIDEIDESFESEYDKSTYEQGPKLLLCDYCKKEYLLPAY
jgi:ribosomal protein S26